jgi:hypothetical protein
MNSDIKILPDGQLQVRAQIVNDIGEKSYHRYVLKPGDDLTGQPEEVLDISKNIWTNDVVYKFNSNKHSPIFVEDDHSHKLRKLTRERKADVEKGYVCSNGIKLDVTENDMNNWSKMMVYILAFHPSTIKIRDYNNVTHEIPAGEAVAMMSDVGAWYQSFLEETWTMKDAILE